MRQIIIQDRETKLYCGWTEQWTARSEKARNFETSLNAIAYCLQNGLAHAQLVVKFGTPDACDVVVPVSGESDRFAA